MRRKRVLGWTVGLAALAAVFTSYLQRDFVFSMANQVWSCF
jgi:hypothetical protein